MLTSGCLSEIRSLEELRQFVEDPADQVSVEVISGSAVPALGPSAKHVIRMRFSNSSEKTITFMGTAFIGPGASAFGVVSGAPCKVVPGSVSGNSTCTLVVTATGDGSGSTPSADFVVQYRNASGLSKSLSLPLSFQAPVFSGSLNTTDFALPTVKIETMIGNDVPRLQAIDLSGATAAGGKMMITDPYLLPQGLVLDSSTDSITGNPTKAGVYDIQLCSVQESMKTSDCRNLRYHILAPKNLPAVRASAVATVACSSSLGTGSSSDPILIASGNDLNTCVRSFPKGAFKMTADIDLAAFTNSTFNLLPAFYGNFDGNGFTIRNLTWNYATAGSTFVGNLGLFRSLQLNAVVKNLTISSMSLTGAAAGSSGVGFLAGYLRGAMVYNVKVQNSTLTNCRRNCSGLVGAILHPAFYNSESDPAPTSEYIDGYIDRFTGTNLSITNPIDPWGFSGGVVGGIYTTPFRISRAKVNATISCGNGGGGIIGFHYSQQSASTSSNIWIDEAQTSGSVTAGAAGGGAMFGGIMGSMDSGSFITNSLSTMNLSANNVSMGGIAGNVLDSASGLGRFAFVNSYFKGTLSLASPRAMMVGGTNAYGVRTYASTNRLYLVQTRTLTSTDPVVGGTITTATDTNQVLNGSGFQLPANFALWPSPPWLISVGSDPTLPSP